MKTNYERPEAEELKLVFEHTFLESTFETINDDGEEIELP